MREAQARLASASGTLKINELALLPTFNITPGVGLTKSVQPSFPFAGGGGGKTSTTSSAWTIGANVSIPVLNIPALLADIDAQDARTQQAAIAFEKAVQTAYGEAENAMLQLAADQRRVAVLTAGEARAERAYIANRKGYGLGLIDLTTTLQAEQSWPVAHRPDRRAARTPCCTPSRPTRRWAAAGRPTPSSLKTRPRPKFPRNETFPHDDPHRARRHDPDRLDRPDRLRREKDKTAPKAPAAVARTVSVGSVETRPLGGGVEASGLLVSREEAAVGSELSGYRVARLYADEGDYVRAGQPLAQLDATLLRAQVDQQAALTAQAQAEAKRVAGLDGQGVLSQEQIETRRYQAKAQEAALNELRTRVSRMTITAPVSGVVLQRGVQPGQIAGGGTTPWFTIARDGLVELDAEVNEADLAGIRAGQPAQVSLPSGQSVSGVVRLVSPPGRQRQPPGQGARAPARPFETRAPAASAAPPSAPRARR